MTNFTTSGIFDSPRGVVFDCWVKPDIFEKWYPPYDCESQLIHADVCQGGYYLQEDRWPDGTHCYLRHTFESVNPCERLAFVTSFCTEDGETASHPFAPFWPKRMLTTLSFEDEGAWTKISVVWEPVEASEEETAFFNEILPSCHQGWTGTFSRLEEALREVGATVSTPE